MRTIALLGSLLVLAAAVPRGMAADRQLLGWIVKIEGPAELREPSSPEPLSLNTSNLFRPVYLGDSLACSPGTSHGSNACVELALLWGGTQRFTNQTFTSVQTSSPPNEVSVEIRRTLQGYQRAGRSRSGQVSSLIREPADRSRLRIGDFTGVRWHAPAAPSTLTVLVTDGGDRVLWRERGISRDTGMFFRSEMLEAIRARWKQSRYECAIELRNDAGQSLDRARFSLLPPEDEAALDGELTWWDEHFRGVPRHLGRSMAFSRRLLHAPAAAELDQALALPEAGPSLELRREALALHRLAGHEDRLPSLERELEENSRPPPPKPSAPAQP